MDMELDNKTRICLMDLNIVRAQVLKMKILKQMLERQTNQVKTLDVNIVSSLASTGGQQVPNQTPNSTFL